MSRKQKLEEIIEGVVTGSSPGKKASSTPGNASIKGDPPVGTQTSTKAGSSIKASGGVKPMPAVATDPEVKNKDADKVSNQTKKAKEPQDAPKNGDRSAPLQGSSKAVKEEEELSAEELEALEETLRDLEEDEDLVEIPESKADMAKSILATLGEMSVEELQSKYSDIVGVLTNDVNEESDCDEECAKKHKGKSHDEYKSEMEEEAQTLVRSVRRTISADDIDMSEDVDALVSGDDELSEEFKTASKTIFEAAVVAKVNSELERIEEEFVQDILEAREQFEEELTNKIDGYLTYAVEEWMKENELAVERGLKTEITENLINDLHKLFTENYIDMPEEKVDVVEGLGSRVAELESKLNEQIERNIELGKQLNEQSKTEIFYDVTKDLADTEVEKLQSLCEGVVFESPEQYGNAVQTLKESYFPKNSESHVEEETDELLTETIQSQSGGSMSRYVAAIGRTNKSRNNANV